MRSKGSVYSLAVQRKGTKGSTTRHKSMLVTEKIPYPRQILAPTTLPDFKFNIRREHGPHPSIPVRCPGPRPSTVPTRTIARNLLRTGTATNANGHDQETQLPDSARLEPQVQLDDGVALDIGNRQLFLCSTLPVYGHFGVGPRGKWERVALRTPVKSSWFSAQVRNNAIWLCSPSRSSSPHNICTIGSLLITPCRLEQPRGPGRPFG